MSRYIKVDDLQRYCDNQKDHSITPNDFQRMNFIELPDKYGRLIDADICLETFKLYCQGCKKEIDCYSCWVSDTFDVVKHIPTVLEASDTHLSNGTVLETTYECPHYQGVCGLDESIICFSKSNRNCDIKDQRIKF